MKTKTWIYISAGVGIVALLILLLWLWLRKKKISASITIDTNYTDGVLDKAPSSIDKTPYLKKGSQGQEVINLQAYINAYNRYHEKNVTPLAIDGIFGAKTETAVKSIWGDPYISKSTYLSIIKI